MTLVALGPYEHTGAYVGSELFDTSGTPKDFCPLCEHAPCVANTELKYPEFGVRSCERSPRNISVSRLIDEIRDFGLKAKSDMFSAVSPGLYMLAGLARTSPDPIDRRCAADALAKVLDELRQLVGSC